MPQLRRHLIPTGRRPRRNPRLRSSLPKSEALAAAEVVGEPEAEAAAVRLVLAVARLAEAPARSAEAFAVAQVAGRRRSRPESPCGRSPPKAG